MSLRAALSFGTSLLVLVVACGGGTTGVAGGGAGTDGGTGGSGGEGGTGEGGGTCTTAVLPGDRACVPGTARAGTPLTLEVDATNGCLGCFTTLEPCRVEVSGTTITMSITTKTCPPSGDQSCPAICALPRTTCNVPALAAGTYTIVVTGDGARTGLPPRELVVGGDATETSCKLPQNGMSPEPLDGTKYVRSCSNDAECVLATTGNVCSPCKCPDTAISKSASPTYEAQYRARASQCAPTNDGPACAACAPAKAKCAIDPTAFTGTCELTPGL
jgi:hypothetical protein